MWLINHFSVTDLVRQIKKKYKGYVKYSYPIKDMKRGHNVRFNKYQRTLIKKKKSGEISPQVSPLLCFQYFLCLK